MFNLSFECDKCKKTKYRIFNIRDSIYIQCRSCYHYDNLPKYN